MSDLYETTIEFPNGEKLCETGTIAECSNWIDNVVRLRGDCSINVVRIDKPKKKGYGIPAMWNDDITFCPYDRCETISCYRNQKNIRDHTVPHSYFMEIPFDCPKNERNCN